MALMRPVKNVHFSQGKGEVYFLCEFYLDYDQAEQRVRLGYAGTRKLTIEDYSWRFVT